MESNRVDDLSASLAIKSAGFSVGAQNVLACATTLSTACETREAVYRVLAKSTLLQRNKVLPVEL